MTTNIQGRIVDRQTGEGIPGLHVELLPLEFAGNPPLLVMDTRDGGLFMGEVDEQRLDEIGWSPLYFRVLRGDQLLTSTEETLVVRLDEPLPDIVIEVELPTVDTQPTIPIIDSPFERPVIELPIDRPVFEGPFEPPVIEQPPERTVIDLPHRPLGELAVAMDAPPALLERLAARQINSLSDILAAGGLRDIEGVLADDPSVARLEAHAKLSLLSPDVGVNERLIDEGFASPAVIARTPRDRFIAQLGPVLDEQVAIQVHASAEVQYRLLNHAVANRMIVDASATESLRSVHKQPCECKDCQSAVSPGAYLADLMDYALIHLQFYWPGFPSPNPMTLDYLTNLFYQPFDKLPVSCDSADEQVRQVRLCIEVLRKYLGDQADLLPNNPAPSYPIKFAFAGDVDGDGRDEVIIAPDWTATATEAFNRQESSALWVMDYDPTGKLWRHLSPVNGHPYEADVVCGPYPFESKFGFAADVDGDGRDEIILGVGKPGESRNEFWIMKYTAGGQWQHLSPIPGQAFNADLDPSGAAVGSRFASAADVDGDNRAEIIIALDRTGAEGRLFWVMDFNPLTNQWSHLSEIQNHPLNADLDPMPDLPATQVQAEFLVVGDFDGDGRDELAINLTDQDPKTGRSFWILDYDPNANPPAWIHLRDSLGTAFGAAYSLPIPVAARFGTAADIDNDGRDELVIGLEPSSVAGADPNALWVVRYAYDQYFRSWSWKQGQTINCSSGLTHVGAAIAVDSDGASPIELAVLPVFEPSSPDRNNPQNGLWIMQFNTTANQWRHQSPIANHPLEADLDWSKVIYPANAIFAADVDGDGRDEIVIYPAPRQALWVMKYDSIADAWQHFSPGVNLARALDRYLLAAYRLLLTKMGTSAEEVRLAHAAQEKDRKALAERLGIDLGSARPDNLDALILDQNTLTEQSLEALFGLVDTTREPFTTIPASKMQTWRLAHLYQSWANQDGLTDDYATQKLPIIDPDIVTPDDFRLFDPNDTSTPAALWLKRRQWVDAQLNVSRTVMMNVQIDGQGVNVPDLYAMLEMLRQQPITYDGQQHVVWSQLGALVDLDTLYINITEKDKELAETSTTVIHEELFITIESFTRLMVIRKKMQAWANETSDDRVTDDEWEEVYSILVQVVKVALFKMWISEEDSWMNLPGQPRRELLSPKHFWIPLREPKEGAWSSALVRPFVDPAIQTLTDLPDSKVGARAIELWNQRQEELSDLTKALQVEYNANGFEALLVMAFGPPAQPPTSWNERLREIKDSLDTGDSAQVEPARAYIEQQLYLSLDQFNRLVNGRAKLDAGKKPTQLEWMQIYALLTGALKKRVQYPKWKLDETNEGIKYWQAFKARLPRWRATPEARQGWQQALMARSQLPIIEPDIITFAYLRNDAVNVKQLYGQRQNAITTRRNLLKNQARDLNGLQAMLLLEDSFGITSAELAMLIKQYADGEIAVDRLDQFGISRGSFAAFSRVYQMLRDNTPIFEDEWEAVYDILTQVWKQRQFADWRNEEIMAKLSLSPRFFQLPKRDPTLFPPLPAPELPPWRATRRALRDWRDTLESRIEQEETVKDGLRVILSEVEEAALPMLRDALVMTSTVPAGTLAAKAKWLSDRLMIDTQSDGCRITTRVAQALETLQTLLWSARTGQLEGLDNLELYAPYFDEEWKWIGSYANWRAAVFVYLYPENIAQPSLRRRQTPVIRKLTQDLRANHRLTPAQARELATTYADYWRDVCSLEIKACARARTRVYSERNGRPWVSYADKLHLFGISSVTGKTYWSTQDSYSEPGYRQSYWQELEALSAVTDLIGAISDRHAYRRSPSLPFQCVHARTMDRNWYLSATIWRI